MGESALLVSEFDQQRLQALIAACLEKADAAEQRVVEPLATVLDRATIVQAGEIPEDVVTMNSIVRLRDLDSGKARVYALTFPADSNETEGRMSILDPLGAAMLGSRVGGVVEPALAAGPKRFRVETLIYQPERTGHYSL